jgi:hypothetical protein
MKTTREIVYLTSIWFLLAAGTATSLLLSGCGTVGGLFSQQPNVVPAQTNFSTVITPASTNAATGVVTPASTNVTATIIPKTTNIVYVVSPGVQTAIGTGQAIAPLVPTPWNGVAEGGLALLSGVLALVAGWKNKQLTAAQKIAAVVEPVVAGVEAAAGPDVKAAIQSHAVAAGVQAVLDPIVQSVSQQMPSAPAITANVVATTTK